jgi:Zn-dependent protease/CBS domain-containing protein
MPFGRGFRIARIGGIDIGIDASWFVIFILLSVLLATAYLPQVVKGASPLAYWGGGVVISLLFFASVVFHELSHALIARRAGIPVNNITLFILGGVAQMEEEPGSAWDEFKMAIAGPLASLVIAVVFLAMTGLVQGSRLWVAAFSYLGVINIVLAVFNLLPGFPMDGGRVFRAFLWRVTGNLRTATAIAAGTGQGFGWLFIIFGLGSLFIPAWRPYSSPWLALVGWFLINAARQSYQQLMLRETLRRVPIGDVMNPSVMTIAPDLPVERLVTDYFLRDGAPAYAIEANGEVIGLVGLEDVRNLPRDEWALRTVRDIMHPMVEEPILHPDADAWDAANTMARRNADSVFVEDAGHVTGIVTRATIARWLQTHTRWAAGNA